MSDRFACEVTFAVYHEDKGERHVLYGTKLVSTIPDLIKKCTVENDIFPPFVIEEDQTVELDDGIYIAFIQGTVGWESNINPEQGTDDGDWVFVADDGYPVFIPLSTDKKDPIKIVHKR